MKYIYKNLTCLLIGIVLLLHTCDLERYPLDEFADDIFWTNEENALLALTGIYKSDITFNAPEYEPSDWWTYGGLIFLEFATDNAYDRRGTNSNFQRMTNGTLLANNDYIKKYWANSYTKISRCNRFLAGINQMEGSADLVARLKAEARFLRATQYFYLSQFFHEVPLVTEVLTWQEANEVKKVHRMISFSSLSVNLKKWQLFYPDLRISLQTKPGVPISRLHLLFWAGLIWLLKNMQKRSKCMKRLCNTEIIPLIRIMFLYFYLPMRIVMRIYFLCNTFRIWRVMVCLNMHIL